MPSRSLDRWRNVRVVALDQIAAAHAAVGGAAPGRRYTTQHINQAYVKMLSGHIQGFCRDLHSEAVDVLLGPPVPGDLRRTLIQARLTSGRKLDRENANAGNLGNDFQLFGFKLWDALNAHDPANADRNDALTQLNVWRNAIAHQEFAHKDLAGRSTVRLREVRGWRAACEALAIHLDAVVGAQVAIITGAPAW
jgi:hypothetical protein